MFKEIGEYSIPEADGIKKTAEAGELELFDKIHDINNEYDKTKEREDYMLDLIDQYMKFLDLWEETRIRLYKSGKKDLVANVLGMSFMDTKKFIDNKMTLLAEEINDEIRKKKLTVIADSSFVDAVNNSTTAWIIGGTKIIKSIDKGEIKSITDLNPVWKQYADGLKKAFKIIPLYLNELCNDRRKLEMELTSVDGYLKKFSKYIISRQAMIGAHKLPYFIFFAKLERGEISQKNIEQEMAILEDSFIKKDLISRDLVTFYK